MRSCILGFGYASLGGRRGRSESLRLLEAAYDAGITHFDVARSYGYGENESILGDFTSTKRDKVTITTKFGILPARRPAGLKAAKSIAKKLVALNPGMRRVLNQRAAKRAAKVYAGGHFTVQDAKSSLESSLQELRTDYIDILLLHECKPKDLDSNELLEFLKACVEEGKFATLVLRRILSLLSRYFNRTNLLHLSCSSQTASSTKTSIVCRCTMMGQ